MKRLLASMTMLVFLAGPVRASELDREFGAKSPAPVVKTITAEDRLAAVAATELDAESPAQSCFFRGGWGGGWGGWGGGWGWGSPVSVGWGGLGWGGGWGWGSPLVYRTSFINTGWGWGGLGWGGGWGGGWCW